MKNLYDYVDMDAFESTDFSSRTIDTNFMMTRYYETNVDNNEKDTFFAVQRNNVQTPIPVSRSSFRGEHVIRVRTAYTFRYETIVQTLDNVQKLLAMSEYKNLELRIIQKELTAWLPRRGYSNDITVNVDLEFPIRKMKTGQGLYSAECDTLFIRADQVLNIPHPYSREGTHLREAMVGEIPGKSAGVFVEIIQNENKFEERYIYVAKKIVKITPHTDRSRKEGVHVTTIGYNDYDAEDELRNINIFTELLTFEEAEEKIGLYKTAEAASAFGDLGIMRKDELTRLEHELQRSKVEYDTVKRDAERADLEARRRYTELSNQFEEEKAKRMDKYDQRKHERADFYDERGQYRKDGSDAWKFAATVAITALGVYAATLKANTGK